MKSSYIHRFTLLFLLCLPTVAMAADVVPPEIQLPGSQPEEVSNLEAPNKCDNCHSGYNDAATAAAGEGHPQDEPATGWRGAAMGNAGRDPIFWATMAIAEQDFDGAGDLCIRCHSTGGWYGGRSTPTDASGLATSDSDGVDCDTCHSMTDPNDTDLLGVMNPPFIANCDGDPSVLDKCSTPANEELEGFYGSGMTSMWAGGDKLGPYTEEDAAARHKSLQSKFHRDVDFCGTCHDVSNSAVGDLAPGNGAQPDNPHSVVSSWDLGLTVNVNGTDFPIPELGGAVENKAAFNNPPYAYGVVERTFSEYKSSAFPSTRVGHFNTLPADLKVAGGTLDVTYQAAMMAATEATQNGGIAGDYADGAPRYFSCQSCHMRPANSAGANKRGVRVRQDLPQHDHTGGNYWLADMIKYQDSQGHLRLGGGLTSAQLTAIDYGQQRAVAHLQQAASLQVQGDNLKVVNLTGHKLISGYPEGRRMWINIKWYDSNNNLLKEDGAYGPLTYDDDDNETTPEVPVEVINPWNNQPVQVESILDLEDSEPLIYEAHYAMTKEWADVLLLTGKDPGFVLNYDRETGDVEHRLADLAAEEAGGHEETFHFALNNHVTKDNRIPPYGMSFNEAQKRNALPVPDDQYGGNGSGSTYNYWDDVDLAALKPTDAVSADITLYYQGTSWEYIQFLDLANNGQNAFLGQEGVNMLEAWINAEVPVAIEVAGDRKMVPPIAMATASWGTPPTGNNAPVAANDNYSTPQDTVLNQPAPAVLSNDSDSDGDPITAVLVADVTNGNLVLNANGSFSYTPDNGFTGADSFTYQADDGQELSNLATVDITVTPTGGGDTAGVSSIETGVLSGKGKNKVFTPTAVFTQGDGVVIHSTVTDGSGIQVQGASVTLSISGPESATLTSGLSDASGFATATWNTSAPNKKGNGGTSTGTYTVTVTGVTADGFTWDGTDTQVVFDLN